LDKIPHAFLIQGSSGTGKTTVGRIIKAELGCSEADYHEFNSSDTRGIDTIREIQQRSKFAPIDGAVKVYLLDEIHMATGPSQEASLKMLEDTPDNVFFILCTTNPEKLRKALKSRCTTIQMSPLNSRDMATLLNSILKTEKVPKSPELIKAIIANSDGSPREAVKLLDSIIDIDNDTDAIKAIETASVSESTVIELCRALLKENTWKDTAKILRGLDEDPESIRRAILKYFMKVLLDTGNLPIAEIMEAFEEPLYNTGKPGLVMACYQASLIDTNIPF